MRRVGRVVAWTANGLLLGLLIGGVAAAHVAPENGWALQLLALTVPYVSVAVTAMVVGALLWRSERAARLNLAVWLVAIALAMSGRATPNAAPSSEDAPVLRVATLNSRGTLKRQKKAFDDFVGTHQPDVMAFQEMTVQALKRTGNVRGGGIAVPILQSAGLVPSQPENDPYVLTAQPIFSNLEPVGSARVMAGYPQEGLWESGGVNRAVYLWQGQRIAVYSIHLHSFSGERPWWGRGPLGRLLSPTAWRDAFQSYRKDFIQRARQAREIRALLDAEEYPFIVCGDFNSTPSNWVSAHLSRGFIDAFAGAGRGWGATYHADFPLFRIDYILASDEWDVRTARVLNPTASDHRLVLAELRLRRARP